MYVCCLNSKSLFQFRTDLYVGGMPSRHGVAVSCCSNRLRSRLPTVAAWRSLRIRLSGRW